MNIAALFLAVSAAALPQTYVSPKDGAEMVLVPAGAFKMGSDDFKVEQPVHSLALPAYYIDKYEVTNALYEKFVKATGYAPSSEWQNYAGSGLEKYPARGLAYADCKAYAEWAGKRLPTEAEWEKAARGTRELRYPWGPAFAPRKCNSMESQLKGPAAVGSFPDDVSPFGAFDMAGNVAEWTCSAFNPYPLDKLVDQTSLPESRRDRIMLRGGSYSTEGPGCRLTQRGTTKSYTVIPWVGFRCVLDASVIPPGK